MARTRKTPQTWIDAGLTALRAQGPDGLRAETLARTLETTKGSFYWHFKDVPAFHEAVLAAWRNDVTARFTKVSGSGDSAVSQLRALGQFRPKPVDLAVRAWATHNKAARKEVDAVDASMIDTIGALLAALDATHPDFPGLVHAALIASPKKGNHAETLIDLLLMLK